MSPMQARHQRKHITHISWPPTQARYLRHPHYHKEHAISQILGTFKAFSSQIQKGNLAVFTFSFYLHPLLFRPSEAFS